MSEVLWTSPVVWGAIIGLLGVLAGVVVTFRKDSAAIAIQVAQEAREDVKILRKDIRDMEEKIKNLSKRTRTLEEKYSVALTDSATVRIAVVSARTRLAAKGVVTAELPPVPEIIADDMRHAWPEVFEGMPEN